MPASNQGRPSTFVAVDPGNADSAYVWCRLRNNKPGFEPIKFGKVENSELREMLGNGSFADDGYYGPLAIETPKPRGMPTAAEEMETLIQIGHFLQIWQGVAGKDNWSYVFRQPVKLFICGRTQSVSDANVRQAIIDMFGGDEAALGGRRCQICKGSGFYGRETVHCETCLGEKLVPAKKPGQLKKCPSCNARGTRAGNPAVCQECNGAAVETPPGPLFGAAGDVYAAIAVAAFWNEHPTPIQRLASNVTKKGKTIAEDSPDVRRIKTRTSAALLLPPHLHKPA